MPTLCTFTKPLFPELIRARLKRPGGGVVCFLLPLGAFPPPFSQFDRSVIFFISRSFGYFPLLKGLASQSPPSFYFPRPERDPGGRGNRPISTFPVRILFRNASSAFAVPIVWGANLPRIWFGDGVGMTSGDRMVPPRTPFRSSFPSSGSGGGWKTIVVISGFAPFASPLTKFDT